MPQSACCGGHSGECVVRRLIAAERSGDSQVKQEALQRICRNFEGITGDDQGHYVRLNCALMLEIITSPQLVARVPTVFKAVTAWADADADCRSRDMETLLKEIPFAAADPDDKGLYTENAIIEKKPRHVELVEELWDDGSTQRATASNGIWYGDISSLLERPLKSASKSFFCCTEHYLLEFKATTHRNFVSNDKGLDMSVRLRWADSSGAHSRFPLQSLKAAVTFVVANDDRCRMIAKNACSIDLMRDSKNSKWHGVEDIVSCAELCGLLNCTGVEIGMSLNVKKACTLCQQSDDSSCVSCRPFCADWGPFCEEACLDSDVESESAPITCSARESEQRKDICACCCSASKAECSRTVTCKTSSDRRKKEKTCTVVVRRTRCKRERKERKERCPALAMFKVPCESTSEKCSYRKSERHCDCC